MPNPSDPGPLPAQSQITAYLSSRLQKTTDEETQRLLNEAYDLLADVAIMRDEAVKRGCSTAELVPSATWFEEQATKMKQAQQRLSVFGEPTHLNLRAVMTSGSALAAIYEARLEQHLVSSAAGHGTDSDKVQALHRYLDNARKILSTVAKIKDKAVKEGLTFTKASPSAQWLEVSYAGLDEARSKFLDDARLTCKMTHLEEHVAFMSGSADGALLHVMKQGRGYKPDAYAKENGLTEPVNGPGGLF